LSCSISSKYERALSRADTFLSSILDVLDRDPSSVESVDRTEETLFPSFLSYLEVESISSSTASTENFFREEVERAEEEDSREDVLSYNREGDLSPFNPYFSSMASTVDFLPILVVEDSSLSTTEVR
jgi:hypothetical protein